MGPEVHDRRPAAGHGDQVAENLLGPPAQLAGAGQAPDLDPRHALAARHLADAVPGMHRDAQGACLVGQGARSFGAHIHDCCDGAASLVDRDGRPVGIVVVRADHHTAPGQHAPKPDVVAHRRGQHHAGHVVIGEAQRPLQRAGRDDDALGAHPPKTMPRRACQARPVIGHPLVEQCIAVIVEPRRHGPGAKRDVLHVLQHIDLRLGPVGGWLAVDLDIALRIGAATPMGGLLDQQHLRPRLARGAGGGQSGDAPADHQDVAMGVSVLVDVRIALGRRLAEARRAADHRFVDVFPGCAGKQERLVVEPGREKRRQRGHLRVHGPDVEIEAGPVVLRARGQVVVEFGRGGALVRLEARARADTHQRIRLLRPARHDAARAVVFEAAPDQHLVIGQKGGGQGVALIARQRLVVEGERDRLGAVDEAPASGQTMGHHQPSHSGRLALILSTTSFGGSVVWAE